MSILSGALHPRGACRIGFSDRSSRAVLRPSAAVADGVLFWSSGLAGAGAAGRAACREDGN